MESPRKASCIIADCERPSKARGLCPNHYRISLGKPCTVAGCVGLAEAHGLCIKHYMRMRSRGKLDLPTAEERFWSKVEKSTECWLWTASLTRDGYGKFGNSYRNLEHGVPEVLAHRVSWFFTYGDIADGLLVCHRCDNPPCVNPAHLFSGTSTDNRRDCVEKGRDRYAPSKGSRHYKTNLSDADVLRIRAECANGARQIDLAKEFNLSQQTISGIVRLKRWAHIEE